MSQSAICKSIAIFAPTHQFAHAAAEFAYWRAGPLGLRIVQGHDRGGPRGRGYYFRHLSLAKLRSTKRK